MLGYRFNPFGFVTNILLIGFIIFYFANQFGMFDIYTGNQDYGYVEQFVRDCKIDQEALIETREKK